MSSNALFGRYWSGESTVHALDPRTKVAGTLVFVIATFCAGNFPALGLVAVFLAAVIACSRIPLVQVLRSIAPLAFIIVLTVLFNLFFVQGGTTYISAGPLFVSHDGVRSAVFIGIRLTLLLAGGSLLTLTTTTLDVTHAFESLLEPLSHLRVPTHEFALVMGIALRFVPQFAEELAIVRAAQTARGAKLSTSVVKGGLAGIASLVVPLFASAFRHADTLSAAMDSRCYHGGVGRGRLNPLAFGRRDAVAACALTALLAGTIAVTLLF